jgi:hypothetical protein
MEMDEKMSVFMLCERAMGLARGKRLELSTAEKNKLESLDYDELVGSGAQEEAVACARHFAGVRDRLLCAHPWTFARKYAAPAQLSSTLPLGWDFSFSLPADCIKVLAVTKNDGRTLFRHYEVLGRSLMANTAPIHIIYTAKITDTGLWDALFADAFCSLLAGELGMTLLGDPRMLSAMEQKAAGDIQTAYAAGLVKDAAQLPFELPGYLDYVGGGES